MRLADVSAVVRPRGAWEAVDLGLLLVRRDYAHMLLASLCVVGPAFLLLALLFPEHPGLVSLGCWWAKPAWERVHLHVLSHALFGERPRLAESLRALPRFAAPGLLPALTVRRLSPLRAFDLPVSVLEQLRGARWRRRVAVLRRGPGAGAAAWCLVLGAHLEGFLLLGLYGLAFVLVPETLDVPWWDWLAGGEADAVAWVRTALGVGTFLVVAPFHVGAGFALYLNRRTRLEAWDLEIAFRSAAARLAGPRVAASLLAGLGLALAALPTPGSAAALDREAARSEIRAVLAGEDFHELDRVSLPRFVLDWQLSGDDDEDAGLPEWLTDAARWLGRLLAEGGRVAIIAAAIALALAFAIRHRRWLAGLRPAGRGGIREAPPRVLFGLPVTEASLPGDVAGEARAAWERGRARDALALLYRASLARAMARHRVPLRASATEDECLALATPRLPDSHAGFLARLTTAWQRVAYAHEPPAEQGFDELCADFVRCFDEEAAADAR